MPCIHIPVFLILSYYGAKSKAVLLYIAEFYPCSHFCESMSTQSEKNFYYSEHMEAKWFMGQYIERLLSRLAKEAGLSSGYMTWLINGCSSDKPNPPSPSLDIVLALSKALGVPPIKLVQAYQGQEPDTEPTLEDRNAYEDEMVNWLKQMPTDVLARAFQETHSPQELTRLAKEARNLEDQARAIRGDHSPDS
jgi:transcriptional regulator with XRE-family HTH domain